MKRLLWGLAVAGIFFAMIGFPIGCVFGVLYFAGIKIIVPGGLLYFISIFMVSVSIAAGIMAALVMED